MRQGQVIEICSSEDIQTGVEKELLVFTRMSLYLKAEGEVDITLSLSPNGSDFFEVEEIEFEEAGDAVFEIGYVAKKIKLEADNDTDITAIIYGVY